MQQKLTIAVHESASDYDQPSFLLPTVRMKSLLTICLLLMGSLAACSGDSSGSSSGESVDAPIVAALELIREIPGTAPDGSPNFGLAWDAAYLPDGTIVVADRAGSAIQFFGPDGRPVRTVGRAGSGPGEFEELSWIELCGDRLVARDWSTAKRLTIDGAIEAETPVSVGWLEVACNNKGELAGIDGPQNSYAPMSAAAVRVESSLWITAHRDDERRELGMIPFGEYRPLGKRTRIAVDSAFIYLGVPDSAAIDVFDHSGAKVRTLQLREPLRPASDAHYEAVIEEMVPPGTDATMAEEFRRQIRAIPIPETLPPYSGLFIERDGIVWAVLSSPGDTSTRLRAVSIEGKILANLTISADVRIFDVGADFVIGRVDDGVSGEQRVVVYRKEAL